MRKMTMGDEREVVELERMGEGEGESDDYGSPKYANPLVILVWCWYLVVNYRGSAGLVWIV
jgi:hypothetical protein